MIQRIQTVYLLLTIVVGTVMFFVPLLDFVNEDMVFSFNIRGISSTNNESVELSTGYLPLLFLNIISILISAIAIFLYKNRPLQIKICRINMFLISLFLIMVVFISQKFEDQLGASNQNISFGFGAVLPFISIVLLTLAVKAIKKDEELIRSVDRIR